MPSKQELILFCEQKIRELTSDVRHYLDLLQAARQMIERPKEEDGDA